MPAVCYGNRWVSENIGNTSISLNSINRLEFEMEKQRVLCKVGTECLKYYM
jgi:hypothetical protein